MIDIRIINKTAFFSWVMGQQIKTRLYKRSLKGNRIIFIDSTERSMNPRIKSIKLTLRRRVSIDFYRLTDKVDII